MSQKSDKYPESWAEKAKDNDFITLKDQGWGLIWAKDTPFGGKPKEAYLVLFNNLAIPAKLNHYGRLVGWSKGGKATLSILTTTGVYVLDQIKFSASSIATACGSDPASKVQNTGVAHLSTIFYYLDNE